MFISTISKFLLNKSFNFNDDMETCIDGCFLRFYHSQNTHSPLDPEILSELEEISIKTVGRKAPYPVFRTGELTNELIVIVYNEEEEPIATNISFTFEDDVGNKAYHIGLFLITPEYQRRGWQKYLVFYVMMYYYLNDTESVLNFTDIGRSASAFNAIDTNFKCYPTLKNQDNLQKSDIEKAKKLGEYLYNNYAKRNCAVSDKSTYDKETMVISNSNDECGFEELVSKSSSAKISRSNRYNDYFNKMCPSPKDEQILVFQVNTANIIKSLIGKMLGMI